MKRVTIGQAARKFQDKIAKTGAIAADREHNFRRTGFAGGRKNYLKLFVGSEQATRLRLLIKA
jgi:hypothetical protein